MNFIVNALIRSNIKILGMLVFCVSPAVFAEPELSEEYKKLRTEIAREIRKPYKECIEKESKVKYEMAVRECESQGKGEGVGGGCEHRAGFNQNYRDIVDYDCELLTPTVEKVKEALEQAVIERGISKYKDGALHVED